MSGIREALSAAYEQAETDDGQEDTEVAATPAGDVSGGHVAGAESATAGVDSANAGAGPDNGAADVAKPKPAAEGRDEKGRFAAKAKEEAAAALKADPAAVTKPPVIGEQSAPTAQPEAIKAPQSWTPEAREKWAGLPPEIQRQVAKREKDTAAVLQESAGARKLAADFQAAVAPYEHMIRAEGGDTLKAVSSLFQTAAALRTAPPGHKAQLVAQLVRTYGIPIDALDAALSGETPKQSQQHQGEYRDPRLDQLLARAEQAQQAKQQAVIQRAQQEAAAFAEKAEFIEDVRGEMADYIEMKHRQGVEVTLQAAYDWATRGHPEISKVLQQRESAKTVATAQASTQRARDAASSVKTQPAGPQGAASPKGVRGALEAAFTAHSGR